MKKHSNALVQASPTAKELPLNVQQLLASVLQMQNSAATAQPPLQPRLNEKISKFPKTPIEDVDAGEKDEPNGDDEDFDDEDNAESGSSEEEFIENLQNGKRKSIAAKRSKKGRKEEHHFSERQEKFLVSVFPDHINSGGGGKVSANYKAIYDAFLKQFGAEVSKTLTPKSLKWKWARLCNDYNLFKKILSTSGIGGNGESLTDVDKDQFLAMVHAKDKAAMRFRTMKDFPYFNQFQQLYEGAGVTYENRQSLADIVKNIQLQESDRIFAPIHLNSEIPELDAALSRISNNSRISINSNSNDGNDSIDKVEIKKSVPVVDDVEVFTTKFRKKVDTADIKAAPSQRYLKKEDDLTSNLNDFKSGMTALSEALRIVKQCPPATPTLPVDANPTVMEKIKKLLDNFFVTVTEGEDGDILMQGSHHIDRQQYRQLVRYYTDPK
ncbi:MAG: hypothetical protein ACHQEM_13530, partial [Chitinophagales bacterium]